MSKYPTPEKFMIEIPLYENIVFDDENLEKGQALINFDKTLDAYCPECNMHSIFERKQITYCNSVDGWINYGKFAIELQCSRNKEHKLFFLFFAKDKSIQKIGQLPSIASLNLFDVKKYSKVLDKQYFQEFTKAIGLSAHGIGVGSFVYLRRIFEFLIEETHLKVKQMHGWDEAVYISSRMNEKINLLKSELPAFLVENKALYAILSKGIHELSEETCLDAFPIVKVGIELILDDKIEKMNKQKKLEEAKKEITKLTAKI
jgi:hypothetical protein